MYISKLYIEDFKGISKRELDLKPGLNIIRGKTCSGKTSIVDSLLFLHRYSITPTLNLESLLHTWFTYAVVYRGKNKFSIIIETNGADDEKGFFGLSCNTRENIVKEFYVYRDTVISIEKDYMEISSIFLSRNNFFKNRELDENIWSKISKKRIKFRKLPWKTISGLVWSEITHYGFEIAYKKIPEAVTTILLNRARDLNNRERNILKKRLVEAFRYAFKINRFLKKAVIVKNIDYKNAIGPSKLRGHSIDPHFSNLPWILYNLYRFGKHENVIKCLSELNLSDGLYGIEKTIDHRYYIVVSSHGREVIRDGIAISFIKSLALCTAISYAEDIVIIDDFDEYLDENITSNFLRIAMNSGGQVILTTRRSMDYLKPGNKISVIELM